MALRVVGTQVCTGEIWAIYQTCCDVQSDLWFEVQGTKLYWIKLWKSVFPSMASSHVYKIK